MYEAEINYFAILVATTASTLACWFWYSPLLFGRFWSKSSKITQRNFRDHAAVKFGAAFINQLFMAFVIAHFVDYLEISNFTDGLQLGVWIWAGFVAATSFIDYIFEERPTNLFLLSKGSHLISILVIVLIIVGLK